MPHATSRAASGPRSTAADVRRGHAIRVALAGAALAVASNACVLDPAALDGPIAVNLHITPTPTTIDIDAPGWFAPVSGVHLCATAPPFLPDPGPARIAWTPGAGCHDFGRFASEDGLVATLPLDDLSGEERATFAAAPDWYVLLLELDGDRVDSAVRSRFTPPAGFDAS